MAPVSNPNARSTSYTLKQDATRTTMLLDLPRQLLVVRTSDVRARHSVRAARDLLDTACGANKWSAPDIRPVL